MGKGRVRPVEQLRAAHRKHFFVEQPAAFALFEASIAKQHRDVDIGAQHVVATLAGDQAYVHIRIGLVEAMQTRHQPISSKGEVSCDLQHFMLALGGDRIQPRIDRLHPALHITEQHLASIGQLDTTVDAIKQTRGQLFLQALDLLADRRLRGAQFHRSGGKAALTCGGFKRPQQVQ